MNISEKTLIWAILVMVALMFLKTMVMGGKNFSSFLPKKDNPALDKTA